MTAYYNEIDPYAAQWLRNLIAAGLIAPGEVDERSIVEVRPDDLRGFTQCHFFAGIDEEGGLIDVQEVDAWRKSLAAVAAAGEQQPVAWRAEEDARKLFERVHCGGNKEFARRNSTTGDYVVVSCADAWAGWWSALSSGYASPVAQGWQPIREALDSAHALISEIERCSPAGSHKETLSREALHALATALALLPEPPRHER